MRRAGYVQTSDDVINKGDSQIYPESRRMEADGLIHAETIPRGTRAEKRRYAITPRGRASLRAWVGDSLSYGPERNVHHLHMAYAEFTDFAGARRMLREHLEYYMWRKGQWDALLETIREATFPLLRARIDESRPELRRRVIAFKELALEVKWLTPKRRYSGPVVGCV
jgi:DNA-binding PadR family transcriptional regulator